MIIELFIWKEIPIIISPNNMKYDVYVSNLLEEMKCWKGYYKKGSKTSSRTGKRVNNCVKKKKKK